jgi:hypothetical protein
MEPEIVKSALISVLRRVQERTGLACPPLSGSSVPVKALEKFNSKVWPAATTWLARELGIEIPKNVHIFGAKRGQPPLTIDQAVALVCEKGRPRKGQASLAAE